MANGSARGAATAESASLVGDVFSPAPHDVLRAARELLTYDHPLDAELWASELVQMWHGLCLVDDEAERVHAQSLLRFARQHPAPEALACSAALAAVATPPVARKARRTSEELQRRGVRAPSWAAKLRQVRVVGAWTAGDHYGDQEAVLLAFAHPGTQPHTFQLLVDHNFGGMVKDGFLTDAALEQVLDEWYPSEAWVFQAVEPAEAVFKVRWGLTIRDRCLDAPHSKSLEECRVLLDARLGLFPQEAVSHPEPLDAAARSDLVEAFFASPEAIRAPDDRRLASMLVDYRCDFCGEDPLRWSPTVALLFLLDWLPRKVTLPPEAIPRVPAVLRAWVRFAGRRRRLASNLIEEIVTTIGKAEGDYLDAVRDAADLGPARAAVGGDVAGWRRRHGRG